MIKINTFQATIDSIENTKKILKRSKIALRTLEMVPNAPKDKIAQVKDSIMKTQSEVIMQVVKGLFVKFSFIVVMLTISSTIAARTGYIIQAGWGKKPGDIANVLNGKIDAKGNPLHGAAIGLGHGPIMDIKNNKVGISSDDLCVAAHLVPSSKTSVICKSQKKFDNLDKVVEPATSSPSDKYSNYIGNVPSGKNINVYCKGKCQ